MHKEVLLIDWVKCKDDDFANDFPLRSLFLLYSIITDFYAIIALYIFVFLLNFRTNDNTRAQHQNVILP